MAWIRNSKTFETNAAKAQYFESSKLMNDDGNPFALVAQYAS